MHATAVQSYRWFIFALAGVLCLILPFLTTIDIRLVLVFFVLFGFALFISRFFPHYGIHLYLIYLSLDGAIKMLSHYNKILHVGSDILLIATFGLILLTRVNNSQIKRLSAEHRNKINTVLSFLCIYWLWIFVQYLNPWGLGILPNLGALKVYIVPHLTFLIIVLYATDHEIRIIPFIFLFLGLLHAIFALIDWSLGMAFWPAIDPFYLYKYEIYKLGAFGDDNYRPFGLTAVPGLPTSFILYGVLGGFFAIHLVRTEARLSTNKWIRYGTYLLFTLLIPLAIYAQLACQVRTTLVRTLVIVFAGVFLYSKRAALIGAISFPLLLGAFFAMEVAAPDGGRTKENFDDRRFAAVFGRAQTLGDIDVYKSSRHGALTRMMNLARITTMGTGLGYGSPHVGMWSKYIENSKLKHYSYSENVYNFVFNELGLWGLFAWILTVGSILYFFIADRTYLSILAGIYVIFVLAAGVMAEITFTQPDASLFWTICAWTLRYQPSSKSAIA